MRNSPPRNGNRLIFSRFSSYESQASALKEKILVRKCQKRLDQLGNAIANVVAIGMDRGEDSPFGPNGFSMP